VYVRETTEEERAEGREGGREGEKMREGGGKVGGVAWSVGGRLGGWDGRSLDIYIYIYMPIHTHTSYLKIVFWKGCSTPRACFVYNIDLSYECVHAYIYVY